MEVDYNPRRGAGEVRVDQQQMMEVKEEMAETGGGSTYSWMEDQNSLIWPGAGPDPSVRTPDPSDSSTRVSINSASAPSTHMGGGGHPHSTTTNRPTTNRSSPRPAALGPIPDAPLPFSLPSASDTSQTPNAITAPKPYQPRIRVSEDPNASTRASHRSPKPSVYPPLPSFPPHPSQRATLAAPIPSFSSSSSIVNSRATPSIPFPLMNPQPDVHSIPRSSLPPTNSGPFPSLRHLSVEPSPNLKDPAEISLRLSPFNVSRGDSPAMALQVKNLDHSRVSYIGVKARDAGSLGLTQGAREISEETVDDGYGAGGRANGTWKESDSEPGRNGSETSGLDDDDVVLVSRDTASISKVNGKKEVSPGSDGSPRPSAGSEAWSRDALLMIAAEGRKTLENLNRIEVEEQARDEEPEKARSPKRRRISSNQRAPDSPRPLVSLNELPPLPVSPAPFEVPRQVGSKLPDGWTLQIYRCSSKLIRKRTSAHTLDPFDLVVASKPCLACIRRQSGYTCAFKDIRAFRKLADGTYDPRPAYFRTRSDTKPKFPSGSDFNAPFDSATATLIKTVAADKIAPTMRKELDHASQAGAFRVTRDVETINNCDTCLHVILCGSWICGNCGQEVCFDCHSTMQAIEAKERGQAEGGGGDRDVSQLSQLSAVTLEKLVKCRGPDAVHGTSDFAPLTRLDVDYLDRTVREMEEWKKDHPLEPPKRLPEGWLDQFFHQPRAEENSHPYLVFPPALLASTAEDSLTAQPSPLPPSTTSDDFLDGLDAPLSSVPALPDGFFALDVFRSVWSRGEAMVAELDLPQVSSIGWSPDYFIDKFGKEQVTIASNIPGVREHTETVGSFFERFGRGESSRNEKIKDWPPSTDFRNDFPELWQDFMQMLPIGSVTRRDGVLNISTHTPNNANPPDLGPKGYFSEISDDTEGGQGSTKLHMDVADAVNVLLWSSDGPEQMPGFAVWDLYRAEDADKIREFLYELIARMYYDGDVAQAKREQDDPIHTQRFFLDESLRKQLWERKGVKSWRIQQHPGQVVFIPAGCAHQVCNFSACIKVASDFVSIENVGRCWKVTDEFRQQTKEEKLWRSDVLGLKSQLLWAWESAKRLDSD